MRALRLLILSALLALPHAGAQLPQNCELTAADPTVPPAVAEGERADITLTVTNPSNLPADVTVAASTSTPGWSIEGEPDQTQTIPSDGSAAFTFSVAAGPDASGDATVSFAISGSCTTPLGGCPGGACDAPPVNAQGTVQYRPPEGFRLPGLDNVSFPLEYLVAGIILIALASAIPFVLRTKRRAGVTAECPEPLKMVRPGRGTSFPIELRNPGSQPATATFEVGAVPEGWSAFMPLPEVQLAAREARSLWLMVRSPPGAQPGETVDVELRLRDAAKPSANGRVVKVRAEVNANAPESPPRQG